MHGNESTKFVPSWQIGFSRSKGSYFFDLGLISVRFKFTGKLFLAAKVPNTSKRFLRIWWEKVLEFGDCSKTFKMLSEMPIIFISQPKIYQITYFFNSNWYLGQVNRELIQNNLRSLPLFSWFKLLSLKYSFVWCKR